DPSPESIATAKLLQKKKTRKPHEKSRRLNARERRAFKIYDIPVEAHRYDIFLPLHKLWQGYMEDVYSHGTNLSQFAQKLLKADFHGGIFKVIKSKNPSYVGIEGIVIQETLNVFKIISKNNKLQQIPKASSVFTMEVECCASVFTLYGSQLQFRAADRAVKKFKPKPSIDL
ncbi:Rof/RNase P-like protein, partial [Phycomyces nitens]